MSNELFGRGNGGEPITRVRLTGGGLSANILTWGAIIQDLRLEGHDAPLVLGFEDMEGYLHHSPYFGATPGRNSNRIANGRFHIDGVRYQLECNEGGITHLHGGSDGIANRNWEIAERSENRLVLSILDPEGRAGYPGNCEIRCIYELRDSGTLSVIYESRTDKPTIANVCQHSYFNLDGMPTTELHELQIAAEQYLPTNGQQIPEGGPVNVANTEFDFRQMKSIVQHAEGEQVLYDHNFCLSAERTELRQVAHLRSRKSGINLRVSTTEPGLQFYAGFKMNVNYPGLEKRHYQPFAGLCLETQIWPDAVNQENFPNAVLRPGEILRQSTLYSFSGN